MNAKKVKSFWTFQISHEKRQNLKEISSFLEMVEVLGAMLFPNLAAAAASSVYPAVDQGSGGQNGQNHQDLFGRKHLNHLDLLLTQS